MNTWIQVYSNLAQHPKTYKLAGLLNIKCSSVASNTVAAGLLVNLWCWVSQNASDGDLTGLPNEAIAGGAGWTKKADTFVNALHDAGFLDMDGKSVKIHDWLDYASTLLEQEENRKRRTRERVQRYRDRKAAEAQDATYEDPAEVIPAQLSNEGLPTHDCNVTETLCNASTRPDHTRPNLTIPLQTSLSARKEENVTADTTERKPWEEVCKKLYGHYPNE